jgi:hypothetical protein
MRHYRRLEDSAPPGASQEVAARECLAALLRARELARQAGSNYTLPRIEAAISSARGAVRAAEGRSIRASHQTTTPGLQSGGV